MLVRVQLLAHTTKIGLKYLLEYFHINTMSVAPLAISSICTLFLLSFNTVLPVKSWIAIFSGFCFCFSCTGTYFYCTVLAGLLKQQSLPSIRCCGSLFLSSTNFILPLELLIGFFSCYLGGPC